VDDIGFGLHFLPNKSTPANIRTGCRLTLMDSSPG
jgi:hypothetical protein